jgi:hypothetical protein
MLEILHMAIMIIIIIIAIITTLHKKLKISSFGIAGLGILIGIEFVLLEAYIIAIFEIGFLSCIATILLLRTINIIEGEKE